MRSKFDLALLADCKRHLKSIYWIVTGPISFVIQPKTFYVIVDKKTTKLRQMTNFAT
jgi:hypothetical protein